jgi:hypothetical protein
MQLFGFGCICEKDSIHVWRQKLLPSTAAKSGLPDFSW